VANGCWSKLGRKNEFRVIDKAILKTSPEVGATVLITPYHRRRFDGLNVGAPEKNGMFTTYTLGDSDSRIPVDRSSLQSSYLRDLINQLSKLPAGDGVRNIGNMLVDAGGANPGVAGYKDIPDEDAAIVAPAIAFNIDTKKFKGVLSVEYNRGIDYYEVVQLVSGEEVNRVSDVDFTSLGAVITDLVDDGEWIHPRVEVLKKHPRRKRPKA